MARVAVPERGQPLDVAYIYSLATAINDLATQVSDNATQYSTIYSSTMGNQNVKTNELRIVTATENVINGETVIADTIKDYSFNFPSDFKYIPTVTMTPVNIGKNDYGNNVIVTIKEVTTSRVDYTVRFNLTGSLSLSVNLIAVGLPQ
jgi:hypothetical protein